MLGLDEGRGNHFEFEILGMAFIIQELGDSDVMVGRWWGRYAVLFVDAVHVVGP